MGGHPRPSRPMAWGGLAIGCEPGDAMDPDAMYGPRLRSPERALRHAVLSHPAYRTDTKPLASGPQTDSIWHRQAKLGPLLRHFKVKPPVSSANPLSSPVLGPFWSDFPVFHSRKEDRILSYPVVLISSLVVALLVLFLAREVRLRRALESLLRRLLDYWRSDETNPVDRRDRSDRRL